MDEYLKQANQRIIEDYKNTDYVDPITKINDNLYLGQGRTTGYADILSHLQITHVVSVGRSPHQAVSEGSFHRCELENVKDTEEENLSVHFPTVFDFVRKALKDGGKVFIHCEMGSSRGATVMVAFLRANGYFNSLQEAYNHVKHKRPWVNPNSGFKKQLQKFFSEKLTCH
jgi:hypothetical protein